ncbi:MAG: aminodeoxychorismate synthase component I [Clostridiales bacterium]|nr:aminodeoxychorismate synthase component I [Clostridiales bacterium]MCF8023221.1 aminodeoxychorismate synthase component I [Clostridiales bacterium]
MIKQVDLKPDSLQLYGNIKNSPYSFLLDSGLYGEKSGIHSFLGALPFITFEAKGRKIKLNQNNNTYCYHASPVDELQRLLNLYAMPACSTGFPLNGGAVGYFSYDLGRQFEKLPVDTEDDLKTPDCSLGFYDVIAAVNHVENKVYIISTGLPEKGNKALKRADKRLNEMEALLNRNTRKYVSGTTPVRGKLRGDFTKEEYSQAVQKVIDYIYAGDIFQANLTQRFFTDYRGDTWQLYKKLREINPAPFASYLNFGDFKVISSSPERFMKVDGKKVQTRPIKGTRPRGKTIEKERMLREELVNSEKDHAELMMIVDLERNDLGRVCRVGSVKVPELVCLEEYATVFHLVSTAEGELPAEKDVVDLLKESFPGGSITGAPKIRAMEIIEELEPVRRGIYTGSIGYIGFDGRADLNIVIRTIIKKEDRLYFQVGGGITAGSEPLAEYEETLDKARALINALGL